MKIGILEAGAPPAKLAGRFDSFGNMVRRLLGPAFSAQSFDVQAGQLPEPDSDCRAFVITGSPSGAYDPDPWIADLQGFIQRTAGRAPMVGICFGHQLMAQAYGGKVIKSPKGQALGLHRYEVWRPLPWMDAAGPISLPAAHGDQVVEVPPGALVLAGSEFTPFGMLAYPDLKATSIQLHPEFTPEFARALVEQARFTIGDVAADAASTSLAAANDSQRFATWLRRFLGTARGG